MSPKSTLETVLAYHQRTKHHFHAYARSLGYLDWANQPDPFRRYEGARQIQLPFRDPNGTILPYEELYRPASSGPDPVSKESIGRLFQFFLGLSAWKEFQGSRWALRMNPSSGNLHPTEGYLVLPNRREVLSEDFGPGGMVGHYLSEDHSLEVRTLFDTQIGQDLMAGFSPESFLIGLTSIHWREAWKYGERAYRYCQHDVGHALAALVFSARMLGWTVIHLENLSDESIDRILGTDREDGCHPMEREAPDLLAVVVPGGPTAELPLSLPEEPIRQIGGGEWFGQANRLSEEHDDWSIIEEVHSASMKPTTSNARVSPPFESPENKEFTTGKGAHEIIAQRRSAVAMDGRSTLESERFFEMMSRVLPRKGNPVWESISWIPSIHLGLFVHHRLQGLVPGLYALVRRPEAFEALKGSMRSEFLWSRPEGCPEDLPLYHLMEGDCQRIAGQVSCGQAIAAEGVFSLGMIAEFQQPIEQMGPWHYRRLFWETGMIGQILYLEAEAAGIRSTGIGCFFDDPVHQIFGFNDKRFQSLYHFTVGGPIEDARLQTQPPYSEERMKVD
ncbi:MAG: nitroreductase family protein [Candidatus Omnitrophica bacterium]|nr:nitroreductase family protein [Candidatus Omnitrophota bacterium]